LAALCSLAVFAANPQVSKADDAEVIERAVLAIERGATLSPTQLFVKAFAFVA